MRGQSSSATGSGAVVMHPFAAAAATCPSVVTVQRHCCCHPAFPTIRPRCPAPPHLQPPGFQAVWHCGVRVSSTGKLVAFISGIPATVRVNSSSLKTVGGWRRGGQSVHAVRSRRWVVMYRPGQLVVRDACLRWGG